MRIKNTVFFLLLASSVGVVQLACGPKARSPETKISGEVHKIKNSTPEIDSQIVKNAEVSCADPRKCPEAAALIIVRTETGLAQCSSFLVGPNLLMTNTHCIEPSIRKAGSDCKSSLVAIFPKSGDYKVEKIGCDVVLAASDIGNDASNFSGGLADWALVRLEASSARKPLSVSGNGLPNGLVVKTYSFDPASDTAVRGILRVKECRAVQNSGLIANFTDAFAPVGAFEGCEIVHGNSGSAAVDSDGLVRAIVHGTADPQTKKMESLLGENLSIGFVRMAALTNIACIDLPSEAGGGQSANASCRASHAATEVAISADDADRLIRAEMAAFESQPATPKWLHFQLSKTEVVLKGKKQTLYSPEISCVTADALKGRVKFKLPYWGFDSRYFPNYTGEIYLRKVADSQFVIEQDGALATISQTSKIKDLNRAETAVELRICSGL